MPSLPHALTRLVGREAEVAALVDLLHGGESRLITLTGAAGVGKSRLAIAAVAQAAASSPADVIYIDLTTLEEPGLLVPALTSALGVQVAGEVESLYELQRAVRERRVMLLLDGFDRHLTAVPVLAELLRGCPNLTVLATSRSRLRVRGERVVIVAPLPTSDLERDLPLAEIQASPAISLFLERARDVRADFALSPDNAQTVIAIVRHLDGLPLALELAAARLDLLSPDALLALLYQRMPVLASRDQDLPDRLHTMRQAVAWSYDLLSSDVQRWFQRLAVFAGSFSLAGAVAVSDGADELTVLEALRTLTDKSLLSLDTAGSAGARFRMLQTLRDFALEQLADSGDEEQVRQVHAAWCLELGERAASGRETGPVDVAALDLLETENANVQAALGWLETHDSADHFLRLAASLGWFWLYRRSRSEGSRWLEAAIAQSHARGVRTTALARALDGAGVLAFSRGDYERAEAFITEYLALSQELNDLWGTPAALNLLGVVARAREEFGRARVHFTAALSGFQARNDALWSALVTLNLGTIAYWLGDLGKAESLTLEGLALYRLHDDAYGIAVALNDLARVVADRGDLHRATGYFSESLTSWQRVGTPEGLVDWIARVATVAADQGQYEPALQLFGAVDRECSLLGYALEPPDRKRQRRSLEGARLALDERVVAAAWESGRMLPMASALERAQALLANMAEIARGEAGRDAMSGLTPRELEVVRLLVDGQSDRQIGERLYISHRTVMSHVARILSKLEVESRTAAATFAVRNGLI